MNNHIAGVFNSGESGKMGLTLILARIQILAILLFCLSAVSF